MITHQAAPARSQQVILQFVSSLPHQGISSPSSKYLTFAHLSPCTRPPPGLSCHHLWSGDSRITASRALCLLPWLSTRSPSNLNFNNVPSWLQSFLLIVLRKKKSKFLVIKQICHGDVMYSMGNRVNNIVITLSGDRE